LLELKNIKKDYPAGNTVVKALKGISIQFRESEFVSILGPSGCGKTTLLNIIGGLDSYTTGDLIINSRSTKDFKDRDWDAYRNHSVGFVFQSYNLIPHQSVLQNVELALSLSGVSKSERRKRAKAVLEDVGLGDQLYKKPAEMSGGQMQRVAIARALVNDPDIILADEPTGALDTQTSIQVMDILKEISKSRLVVMVTHNPDIAQQYSTRIIRMLDGEILSDSAPLSPEELAEVKKEAPLPAKKRRREKKPSMSFFTSFSLSLKNLFTKKGRTVLTSFAGSIGIIGIALIFAVSQGMTTYINAVQEDTLSSYPITLEAQHMDMSSLLEAFMGQASSNTEHGDDKVYQKPMLYNMVSALNSAEKVENDLKTFKDVLELELQKSLEESTLKSSLTGVQYTYNTNLLVYTKDPDGTVIYSDTQKLLEDLLIEYFGMSLSSMLNMGETFGFATAPTAGSSAILWQEMLGGEGGDLINPLLKKQYDVIEGSWPNRYDEIVLVLDEKNELDDMTLYALGLLSKEHMDLLADAAINKTQIDLTMKEWSYQEIINKDFMVVLNSDCYVLDEATGLYADLRDSQAGMKYLYDNGLSLRVSGIVRPNKEATSGMLTGSIGYTKALTEHIVKASHESDAIKAQLSSTTTDIFTGLPFKENTSNLTVGQKAELFRLHVQKLNERQKAEAYTTIMCIPPAEYLNSFVSSSLDKMNRESMEKFISMVLSQQMSLNEKELMGYISSMNDDDLTELVGQVLREQGKMQYAAGVKAQLASKTPQELAVAFDMALGTYTNEQCSEYYAHVLSFSESTYDENLEKLGYVDLDSPSSINLFASSFENKDFIEEFIADYNAGIDDELKKITYVDYIGIMMSSITIIINAITYVLIAFVSISLVVSSIMIGVITLISVQERTKEIGILRAIGASKKNVARMFNAETLIIGFTSGALGVVITYLLCIPINLILHYFTGIDNLNAILPVEVGVILVAISMLLTLFAGIIPSRSAAKKDPVVALRSE